MTAEDRTAALADALLGAEEILEVLHHRGTHGVEQECNAGRIADVYQNVLAAKQHLLVDVIQATVVTTLNVLGETLTGPSFTPFTSSPIPDEDVAQIIGQAAEEDVHQCRSCDQFDDTHSLGCPMHPDFDPDQVPRPASPDLPTPIELLLDGAQAITLWLNGTQPLDAARDWWTGHAVHMRSLAAQLTDRTLSAKGERDGSHNQSDWLAAEPPPDLAVRAQQQVRGLRSQM